MSYKTEKIKNIASKSSLNTKNSQKKSDFDEKWGKIASGEARFEDLGESFTKGDKEALKTAPIGKTLGFSKTQEAMKVLVVHVGYSQEEMQSEEFQKYMKQTKAETQNVFGKKNIDIGFYIPDEKTPEISSVGFDRVIKADVEELAILKRRLQKENNETIDIINVRINPKVAKRDDFGLGGGGKKLASATSPGPKETDGKYDLVYKDIAEHELMHCISACASVANPTYFGDGYHRTLLDSEKRVIKAGNHLEFIPADNNGNPIKTKNKTMQKVLENADLKDENVFMVGQDGKKVKLLTVNPGKNLMSGAFSKQVRLLAIKEGVYLTKAQRIAVEDVIDDYLIHQKRRQNNKGIQSPNLTIKNDDKKLDLSKIISIKKDNLKA